jgi:hypothetical protein
VASKHGLAFIRAARRQFADLFQTYGFVEVGTVNVTGLAELTATNDSHFLEVICDFRDYIVGVQFGPLVEGLVPSVRIFAPTVASEVRSVDERIMAWLATGDPNAGYGGWRLITATTEAPSAEEAIDAAVTRLARKTAENGRRLLTSDPDEWRRAAELMTTGVWRPA